MIAPTFIGVSAEKSCTLADLSVSGYKTPVYDSDMDETEGGVVGAAFGIQFLNGNGTTKATYYWIDDGNGHKGWYATPACGEIEGGASSITIDAGSCLWIFGRGLNLVSAGQVSTDNIIYKTTPTGAVAVGNGTPVDLSLADLTVSGYADPVYDADMGETEGGVVGAAFGVQFLNGNGTTKATYYWIDDGNGHKGWYATPACGEIEGGASSVSIPAGQGMWVFGRGLYLTIPAPTLN